MGPDFFAFLHRNNSELEEAMQHIANSNFGLAQKKLREMYANNLALQTFINGGLDQMAAESEGPIVIDCVDIGDED